MDRFLETLSQESVLLLITLCVMLVVCVAVIVVYYYELKFVREELAAVTIKQKGDKSEYELRLRHQLENWQEKHAEDTKANFERGMNEGVLVAADTMDKVRAAAFADGNSVGSSIRNGELEKAFRAGFDAGVKDPRDEKTKKFLPHSTRPEPKLPPALVKTVARKTAVRKAKSAPKTAAKKE